MVIVEKHSLKSEKKAEARFVKILRRLAIEFEDDARRERERRSANWREARSRNQNYFNG